MVWADRKVGKENLKIKEITGVGIDVSKGYSMIAVHQPGGVTLLAPFRVNYTASELQSLVERIRTLPGEVRIVMEHTGSYWRPIALTLVKAGFFISVVNAMLIHDFRDNSLRRVKTDKADALKIANYVLAFWPELRLDTAENETRQLLKMQCRLYERILASSVVLHNSLISLLDQVFPGVNRIFYQMVRADNGHVKRVDFVRTYWHKECVSALPKSRFMESYYRWCKKRRLSLYEPHSGETLYCCTGRRILASKMRKHQNAHLPIRGRSERGIRCALPAAGRNAGLPKLFPEFDVVMGMAGAGSITGPKIMGEIGDVRRFTGKSALVAFAGVDTSPYQSGIFEAKSRRVSKRGSPLLRRTLFQMCSTLPCFVSVSPLPTFHQKTDNSAAFVFIAICAGCRTGMGIKMRIQRILTGIRTKDATDARETLGIRNVWGKSQNMWIFEHNDD